MTAKHLLLRTQAQGRVLHEVSQLADAVRVTLGPTARAILVERKWGRPLYGKRISSLEALVPVQVALTEGRSKKDEERAPLPE